jgi:hypothetical protein
MRVWISCTVVGVATGAAALFAYGCGVSAFGTCTDNGTCTDDAGNANDGSKQDGTTGGDASDGGGGGDTQGDVTGDSPMIESGCTAPPNTLECDGACVDPTQPAHCGSCGNTCTGGTPECSGNMCSSGCSGATPTNCSGSCVNEQTNPQHCGGCTTVCGAPDGGPGSATCVDSGCGMECAQDGGSPNLCGNTCVNTTTDPNNCSACGMACPVVPNGMPACVMGSSGPTCGATCGTGFHGGGTLCETTCLPNTDDPATDPCVVADAYGTFVSPSGSDTAGCGTKASPCLTIANAMAVSVTATTKRVYACGAFAPAGPVTVTAAVDGVTVYGGFTCGTWAYSAGTPTTVEPTVAGYALSVTGTTTGVEFRDFSFTALNAPTIVATGNTAAASSVAVFANGAKLTLTRVAVNAGSGQPGAGGATAYANYSGANSDTGGPGTVTSAGGAAGGPNDCLDGTLSTGGVGSSLTPFTLAGNGSATPAVGSANGGSTGGGGTTCTGGASSDGANGLAPTTQAPGSQTIGSLGSGGWAPGSPGTSGTDGNPGQGGGGGGSSTSGGGGGGGGAGGCGGGKGDGGQTGGASIGILAFNSNVTLTGNTVGITTASGGIGGAGSHAQDGQAGAAGGSGETVSGCSGGTGGIGGGGGGGGGGAGGPSAGIVWKGTAPNINGAPVSSAATLSGFTVGAPGSGGGGGNGGTGGGNSGAGGGDGLTPSPMAVVQSP